MIETRTPTQVLVDCLEKFGESEPTAVIVIWENQDSRICRQSSTNSSSMNRGLLENAYDFMQKTVK